MLTIKNYHKLNHRDIADDWAIKYIYEGMHNNTYIINLEKWIAGIRMDSCNIMLERDGIVQRTSTHPTETAYFFIFDSQRTDVCVTADWIADIDNMIGQLKYLLKENGKVSYV